MLRTFLRRIQERHRCVNRFAYPAFRPTTFSVVLLRGFRIPSSNQFRRQLAIFECVMTSEFWYHLTALTELQAAAREGAEWYQNPLNMKPRRFQRSRELGTGGGSYGLPAHAGIVR